MPFSVTFVFLIIGKLNEKPIGLRKGFQAILVRFNELLKTAILFDLIVMGTEQPSRLCATDSPPLRLQFSH
jgi:hypothetical protein